MTGWRARRRTTAMTETGSEPMGSGSLVRPQVSVVIPCYNYGRYLAAAVHSALNQTGVDVHVVIVDDASTDDSVEIATRLAASDPRVQLVQQAVNLGHVETTIRAVGSATGEFVVKLDADDLLTSGSLARATELLRAHPEVVFCYGYGQTFEGEPPTDIETHVRDWTIWPGDVWVERVLRRGHNVILQPEVVMRREALEACGGYTREISWAVDYHLWLKMALSGSVGRVNGATQGLYRVHPKSFTQDVADREMSDVKARIRAVELFLEDCGGELTDPVRLGEVARSSLARNAREAAGRTGNDPAKRESYLALARHLDPGPGRPFSLSASPTAVGSTYRGVVERVRWRRWRRFGI